MVQGDVAQKLEELNRHLSLMQVLHETTASSLDVRELAQEIGLALGLAVEVGPEPVKLSVAKNLISFALQALITTVAENRPDRGFAGLALEVRATGGELERTALLSLKGKHLELEGILPEPSDHAIPNLGRLGVFLAKGDPPPPPRRDPRRPGHAGHGDPVLPAQPVG